MQFNLITVGKCKDKNIIALYSDYIKRLKPFAKFNLIELAHGRGNVDEVKQSEANAIMAKINKGSFVIALDERGKSLGTSKLAEFIKSKTLDGFSDFNIIIGGAEGLDQSIRDRADLVLSLSELTFPHMLVRVVIAEQIYRVMTYINNHPYHREG